MGKGKIGTLLIIAAFAPFSIADNIKSLPSLFDFKAINKSFFLISLARVLIFHENYPSSF